MFLSLVQKRRSIRRYLDKPVEPEKIDRLIDECFCVFEPVIKT